MSQITVEYRGKEFRLPLETSLRVQKVAAKTGVPVERVIERALNEMADSRSYLFLKPRC